MPVEPLGRPLGILLQGGGALGAWQAAVLEALDAAGLSFDAVMGYSIGALNGAALAFGRLGPALGRWRQLDASVLRLRPRLRPLSLFSPRPLRQLLAAAAGERNAAASLRAELTVITACPAQGRPVNARFTPGGRGGWDAPLPGHLEASCAIPLIFPPVELDYRGRRLRLIDGGVPTATPFDLSPLAHCAALLVLEMVRADELGLRWWAPWRALDQRCRQTQRGLIDQGLEPLRRAGRPALYRLSPSRRLKPVMLDFRSAGIRLMLELGRADAKALLAGPERFLVR